MEVHRGGRVYSARDGEADFAEAERKEVEMALDAARERITGLEAELETAAQRNIDLVKEVKVLSERVRGERDKTHERITVLKAELERAARHNADLKEEVELLREKVKEEGQKNRGLWRLHCEKLVEYDQTDCEQGEENRRSREPNSCLRDRNP